MENNFIIKNSDGSRVFNVTVSPVKEASNRKISQKTATKLFHQHLKQAESSESYDFEIKGVRIVATLASPLDYLQWKESELNKKVSFFRRLSKGTALFIRWLFRRPPKDTLQDIDLLFAFHLYRNSESELVSGKKNLSFQEEALGNGLKFSDLLHIWSTFLEDLIPFLNEEEQEEMASLIPGIKNLYLYENQIEQIRTLSDEKKRRSAREEFAQKILEDSQNSKGPIYLPGGFSETEGSYFMIFEVIPPKKKNEPLKVRVIDLSQNFIKNGQIDPLSLKHAVTATYSFDQPDALKHFINVTLEARVGNFNPATDISVKSIFKMFKALKRMRKREESELIDSKSLLKTLMKKSTPVKDKKKPPLEVASFSQDLEKLFEIFLKSTRPEVYEEAKTLLQLSTFFHLYEKGSVRLEDPLFRDWMRNNGIHLLESLKKRKKPEQDFAITKLQKIVDTLDRLEKSPERTSPLSPTKQKKQKAVFSESLSSTPLHTESKIEQAFSNEMASLPLSQIDFNEASLEERTEILETFQEKVSQFQNLAKEGKFETLDFQLHDIYILLENASDAHFWDSLTIEEAKKWSPIIRDLGLMHTQAQWAQGRFSPDPRDIYHMLKGMEIADRLYRIGDTEGHFEGICFDVYPFENLLRHPFLSLGEYGVKITKTLEYLKKPDPSVDKYGIVRFDHSECSGSDVLYINRLADFTNLSEKEENKLKDQYAQDMGDKNLLPSQFIDLRKLYIMTAATLQPNDLDLLWWRLAIDTGDSDAIIERAKSRRDEIEIKVIPPKKIQGENFIEGSIKLLPWNFGFERIKDWRINEPTYYGPFQLGGVPVPDYKIKDKLFDQNVSLGDNRVTDEGECSSYFNGNTPAFRGLTQIQILREKLNLLHLPSDVIQELELVHTGDATRVKENVGKLSKHAGLLNDPQKGPILQRFFDQNLFRRGQLFLQIQEDPEYAQHVIKQFKELAFRMQTSHQYRSYLFIVNEVEQLSLGLKSMDIDDPSFEDVQEEIADFLKECHEILTQLRENSDKGISPYKEYRREFHSYALLQTAHQLAPSLNASLEPPSLEEIDLSELLYSFFVIQTSPIPQHARNPHFEDQIEYLWYRLQPHLLEKTHSEDTRNSLCNLLMERLLPKEAEKLHWEPKEEDSLLMVSGDYVMDLRRGAVWKENKRNCVLPIHIKEHPQFRNISRVIKRYAPKTDMATLTTVLEAIKIDKFSGESYQFEAEGKFFKLVSLNDGSLSLYRKEEDKWLQHIRFFTPKSGEEEANLTFSDVLSLGKKVLGNKKVKKKERDSIPRALLHQCDLWVESSSKKERDFYVDVKGEVLSKGKLTKKGKKNNPTFYLSSLKELSQVKSFSEPKLLEKVQKGEPTPLLNDLVKRLFPEVDVSSLQWKAKAENTQFKAGDFLVDFEKGVVTNSQKRTLLNPWKDKSFDLFKAIEDPAHISVKGKREKVSFFKYNRFPLSYVYNKENARWQSNEYRGYYLSSSTLQDYFESEGVGEERAALHHLFSSKFTHYQLLKHDNAHPKVILSGVEYFPSTTKGPQKHRRAGIGDPEYQVNEKANVPLYAFTADPNKGLVAEDVPDGYFYLSYVLLIQGHTQEAIRYLKKATVNKELSPQGEMIISMINRRLDSSYNNSIPTLTSPSSPESIAFKTHLLLMQVRQKNFLGGTQDILDVSLFTDYKKKVTQGLIPLELQLTAAEYREIKRHFKSPFFAEDDDAIKISLQSEIEKLEKTLKQRREELPKVEEHPLDAPISLFETLPLEDYFEVKKSNDKQKAVWKERLADFKKEVVLGQEDPYAQEIGQEHYEDFKFYLKHRLQETISLKEGKLDSLQKDLKEERSEVLKEAHQAKLKALTLLPVPHEEMPEWEALLNQFKQRNLVWRESIFDTALRCFGEKEWSIIQKLYPDSKEFEAIKEQLDQHLTDYLKAAVREQQLSKAIALAESDVKDENIVEELHQILSQKWHYDPDIDEDRGSLLLAEYELGLISRKRQVAQIRSAIHHPDQFQQEICGGGKTTFLRPTIAHLRANGTYLSCISTLSPLRQTHSILFSKTTLHAFGELTFEFKFNRQTPSDEVSLLKLHRNLLWMIANRGRMDLTKGDLLSFKLEQILKQEQLVALRKKSPDSPDIERLHREIDEMENIRDLLQEWALINADELDKDCDPTQEKNYAHGEVESLNADKVEAGLDIVNEIFKAKGTSALARLKKALRKNKQYKLSSDEIDKACQELAGKLFDQYQKALGLKKKDKAIFIDYLTQVKPKDEKEEDFYLEIGTFYEKHFKVLQKDKKIRKVQKKVRFAHEFIAQVIPHALDKQGGVNFGRSEDELHVIPFEGSDKSHEDSQHSLESEQIFYTCADYLDLSRKAIRVEQMGVVVQNSLKKAMQELAVEQKRNPDTSISFEETKTAKKFKKQFGLSLSLLTSDDYGRLTDSVNSDRKKLTSFLRDWVFPEYQNYSEKIVSDAQDPPSMVKSYSGSSGTDSTKYALPDPIDISHAKQPGVHGEIIASFYEIDEKMGENSFKVVKENPESVIKALAKSIKGGDCLSDVAIYFPGISAEAIARKLAKARPELVYQFMNRKDEWKMLKGGVVNSVDSTIPKDQIFTIFDDTHTRGAERPSMSNVTEFLTSNTKTSWSRFEQGALRERGVTKKKAGISHLISESLMKKWENQPSISKLLANHVHNEAQTLKPLNLKGEKQKIKAIARHQCEKSLRKISKKGRKKGSSKHYEARELIHRHTRLYFVRPNEQHTGAPFQRKSGGDVLKELVTLELEKLHLLIDQEGALMKEAQTLGEPTLSFVTQFCEEMQLAEEKLQAKLSTEQKDASPYKPRLKDALLPDNVVGQSDEMDNEQTVEQETEQEQSQEMQQEMQEELEEKVKNASLDYRNLSLEEVHVKSLCNFLCEVPSQKNTRFNLKKFKEKQEEEARNLAAKIRKILTIRDTTPINGFHGMLQLNQFNHVLPGNIYFTENFSEIYREHKRNVKPWGILQNDEKIPKDQNRISRILVVIDLKKNRAGALVTSLKDNDVEIEPYIRQNRQAAEDQGILLSTYNIDSDRVDGGSRWDSLTPKQMQAARELIIAVKFQNGEVNFSDFGDADTIDNQFQTLVNWLLEMPEDLEVVEKSFKAFIAQYRISNKYEESDVQRAFKKAKELKKVSIG